MTFPKVPARGIWVPAVTMFDPETDRLDPESQAKYYTYLSKTGLAGLVILGTNAETFLLTREERKELLTHRPRSRGAGLPHHGRRRRPLDTPGARIHRRCRRGRRQLCAGPAAGLLWQGYHGGRDQGLLHRGGEQEPAADRAVQLPGVCNGVDLDSATIAGLARASDNIVGVKLTCGSVAKITRLAAELSPERFAVFGGQSDFLIGGLAVGSAGCIAAFANVFPKTIVRIYQLWQEGRAQEALELHQKAALAEQPCKSGIASTKYAASVSRLPRLVWRAQRQSSALGSRICCPERRRRRR